MALNGQKVRFWGSPWMGVVLGCCAMVCGTTAYVVGRVTSGFTGAVGDVIRSDEESGAAALRSARTGIEEWNRNRLAVTKIAEDSAIPLARARASLAGTKPGIPRDLAICLEARARADEELKAITLAKGDIGPVMERYLAEKPALDTFCAYALQIGPPN